MATSEAQKRASMRYRAKTKEQMNLDLPIGKKAEYKAQAAKRGLSLNAYIVSLIEKDIESDNLKV